MYETSELMEKNRKKSTTCVSYLSYSGANILDSYNTLCGKYLFYIYVTYIRISESSGSTGSAAQRLVLSGSGFIHECQIFTSQTVFFFKYFFSAVSVL